MRPFAISCDDTENRWAVARLKNYLQSLSRRDIVSILAFVITVSCLLLWRSGDLSIPNAAVFVLSLLASLAIIFGSLFVVAWIVKRTALAFGVPLGKWGSTRALRSFLSDQGRKLARQDAGRQPLARGRTQFLRGLALAELGGRESDTEALRQSAAAFRDALPALRAAGRDEKWALTQANLATALLHLNLRQLGPEPSEEAVEALEAAAEVWAEADNKADWAEVQFLLCAVLLRLGRMQDGTDRLADAVAAGRAALAAEDNGDVPMADARLQINLAAALAALGERETGTERLDEAVAMALESLTVIAEDRHGILEKHESIEWQATQLDNLGRALCCLGERRDDLECLREAVETLQSIAPLRTESNAYDWAMAQHSLARALSALSARTGQPDLPAESLSASGRALEILTRETYPFDWAVAISARANTLLTLIEDGSDAMALRRCVDDLSAALAVFEQAGAPAQRRQCREDLDRAQARLDVATGKGADGGSKDP